MPDPVAAEQSLVHKALVDGDRVAFERLFELHWRDCYAYAAALLRRRGADAEDLVQEGFLRAWRSRRQYVDGMPFAPWVYGIIHHRWVDDVRFQSRRPSVDVGGELDHLPGEAHFAPDRFSVLYDVARALSADQYALFRRVHVEDTPVAQVAEEYGITPQAINYRLRRIRDLLVESGVFSPAPPQPSHDNPNESSHGPKRGQS